MDIDNGVQPPQGTEVSFSGEDTVSFDIPAPPENFVPRDAYKALIKIGLGIMPANELANFRKLLNWLRNDSDQETFPFLDVGISTGSLGNAPRYVAATLLKRTEPTAQAPYMILILTAGSVCWQLDLMPDALDDHCELARFGSININWRAFLQAPSVETIEIAYDQPRHFDWSSPLAVPIPVESIKIEFDWRSNMTNILVRWREMSPGD